MAMSADWEERLKNRHRSVATGRYHSKSEVLREGVRSFRSARPGWRSDASIARGVPMPTRVASNHLPSV